MSVKFALWASEVVFHSEVSPCGEMVAEIEKTGGRFRLLVLCLGKK
ncbi:MAG: hypothetical protein IKD15_01380 [Clostridia bacterium]|nr:hypothetical protein [Clostridia bacterium]